MSNNTENCSCNEKICIRGKKVFDACMKQETLSQITVSVTDLQPPNPLLPLRFVSCKSTSTVGVTENLVVERLVDRRHYGRVQADIVIPVEVTCLDANNVESSGVGTVTLPIDLVMYLPEPSIIPYRIESTVSSISPEGTFFEIQEIDGVLHYIFLITCCVTAVIEITMDVDIIVPTYGYAVIPPCQNYTNDICSGYFELPLYPQNGNG